MLYIYIYTYAYMYCCYFQLLKYGNLICVSYNHIEFPCVWVGVNLHNQIILLYFSVIAFCIEFVIELYNLLSVCNK